MKPKTIYVFANSYKPVLGGVQTVTSQFAEGCRSRGIRTIVIANLYPRQLKIYEKISSTPVIRLPFAIPDGNLKNVFMFGISLCVSFLLFLCCRPDCVYIHFPLSQSSCLSVLHHIFDFKIITCFHGHDVLRYEEGYSKESVQYRAQRGLVRQSDQVTACSGYLARCVERTFGCTNVCVVYNGVDLTRFDNFKPCPVTLENTPYLFAWGRLEQIKGFDLLIQAFARSKSSHELKLLIAGEGSERENLQQLIDALELKDKVMLIGRLTPDDIVQYAQNSEINIIPSRREPFGIVALEAIAAKQPIIATNSGGLPEIISDKYGLTVPVDVGEIRKAIDKILTKEISFDYSDTKEYLKHFTIKRMVENYLILQNNHNGC